MISNIKDITYDFIQKEKCAYGKMPSDNIMSDQDPFAEQEISKTEEIANTALIEQHGLSEINNTSKPIKISIFIDSTTDLSGTSPKRYTTKCYLQPKSVPYWYNENILLFINSTKRKYEERVYFKERLLPVKWSERMWTETNHSDYLTKISVMDIPLTDIYIPLNEVGTYR